MELCHRARSSGPLGRSCPTTTGYRLDRTRPITKTALPSERSDHSIDSGTGSGGFAAGSDITRNLGANEPTNRKAASITANPCQIFRIASRANSPRTRQLQDETVDLLD